jgi:hypothetical protein
MPARACLFNKASFAFETFPGEVVILNVEQGSYFALGGWVLDVWPALTERQPLDRIADAIASRYDAPVSTIRSELDQLVAKLTEEQILLDASPSDVGLTLDEAAATGVLQPLTFEKHTDLQDLMTLDPIHDIDPEQGWPNVRP